MAREPRHLHRLLPLLDPLLRRAPLVVEPHHCPTWRLQVGHDEPHSREQLPGMELNLRHYSSCGLPTGGLIEKALVPHDGLVTGPPHRARQQFLDVSLQTSVGRKPDRILYPSLFQFLVDLRLSEGSIGTKQHLPAQFLLALDLRQKHFIPVLGAMYVAGSQLRSQTVSLPVEQEQRVIT